jgi:hypothetical protein
MQGDARMLAWKGMQGFPEWKKNQGETEISYSESGEDAEDELQTEKIKWIQQKKKDKQIGWRLKWSVDLTAMWRRNRLDPLLLTSSSASVLQESKKDGRMRNRDEEI